jgi:hypothetical protein
MDSINISRKSWLPIWLSSQVPAAEIPHICTLIEAFVDGTYDVGLAQLMKFGTCVLELPVNLYFTTGTILLGSNGC